jgi:enoyl-CoA hydratase/carnithine racemase
MADYGVQLEKTGKVAIVTLDRPGKNNAFDEHMWDSLDRVVSLLAGDLPRVVVVTGAGAKAFSAGFDVNPENPQVARLADAVQRHEEGPAMELIRRVRLSMNGLVTLPVPVIAAINGLAYGGGAELATQCDLRVMDPGASICFSEVRLGLMPDQGGGVGLTRLIGPSKAADLILTARVVGTEEAFALGLVNRISALGKAREEALALAGTIADNGPRAVRHALKVIRATPELSRDQALALETQEAVELIASGECLHGITAFLARTKPEFP